MHQSSSLSGNFKGLTDSSVKDWLNKTSHKNECWTFVNSKNLLITSQHWRISIFSAPFESDYGICMKQKGENEVGEAPGLIVLFTICSYWSIGSRLHALKGLGGKGSNWLTPCFAGRPAPPRPSEEFEGTANSLWARTETHGVLILRTPI